MSNDINRAIARRRGNHGKIDNVGQILGIRYSMGIVRRC